MPDPMIDPSAPTTLGGFGIVAATLLLTYILKMKFEKPREEAKLGNLESQSRSLIDQNNILREMSENQKKYSKFGRKQSKKINKKLAYIHDDVIIVKNLTSKKKE